MKKIIIFLMLLTVLTGCSKARENQDNNAAVGVIGQDTPIKRYQVAKMLALSVYDISTIESMERKIVFQDTDIEKPYDKYINAAFTAGLISGADETHFEPEGYLSLEQAQFLLNKLDKSGTLKLQYNKEDRKKPISASMWTEVFERTTELSDNKAVVSCNIIPYATGENCAELGSRFIMTDRGLLSIECCDIGAYNDCILSVIMRDKEVLALKSVVNTEPSVMGAVVVSTDDKGVTLDMGGAERYFYLDNTSGLRVGDSISFKYIQNKITELENSAKSAENVSISNQ